MRPGLCGADHLGKSLDHKAVHPFAVAVLMIAALTSSSAAEPREETCVADARPPGAGHKERGRPYRFRFGTGSCFLKIREHVAWSKGCSMRGAVSGPPEPSAIAVFAWLGNTTWNIATRTLALRLGWTGLGDTMPFIQTVIAAALFVLVVPQALEAAPCPRDATKASLAIFPAGSIKTGQTATAKHPCGRQLQCSGGLTPGSRSRSCRWL